MTDALAASDAPGAASDSSDRIALVGWGKMGSHMGRRLLEAGHDVVAFDVSSAALDHATSCGATVAATPADAVASADVVITMLPDPTAVEAVADEVVGALTPAAVWIEMSSSHPETTSRLAQAATAQGAVLLDAPVSGGVTGARNGTLTVMVAGPASSLDQVMPILSVVASTVTHVGLGPGEGDLAKTINNLLSVANLTAAAEALALGVRGGLDPAVLMTSVSSGSGSSNASAVKIPNFVLTETFDAGFTIDQYVKDLRIALDVADRWDVEMPIARHVLALWERLSSEGHGAEDHTAAVVHVARDAGVLLPGGRALDGAAP